MSKEKRVYKIPVGHYSQVSLAKYWGILPSQFTKQIKDGKFPAPKTPWGKRKIFSPKEFEKISKIFVSLGYEHTEETTTNKKEK